MFSVYAFLLAAKHMVKNYCVCLTHAIHIFIYKRRRMKFNFYEFFFKQGSAISADTVHDYALFSCLVRSAVHSLSTAMFCFKADRGNHEHFFGSVDVVVMIVDVAEISTSSKKHTLGDTLPSCHCYPVPTSLRTLYV